MTSRRQATLYVPPPFDADLDAIRIQYNPLQQALIRPHITLCREDEVRDWDELSSRLSMLAAIDVNLTFGGPVREGNLVYLPAIESTESFDQLRFDLLCDGKVGDGKLDDGKSSPRKHNAHLTLVHPRNGVCTDETFEEIQSACMHMAIHFRCVTLIEQIDGGPWRDLQSFGS